MDASITARRTAVPTAFRRLLLACAYLALLTLGCSAADWLEQERATPTPEPVIELQPTFTPVPAPVQTLVIVTPPADGRPGVIIIPPGMDPGSVLPVLPTEPPTVTPSPTATPPAPDIAVAPESPLLPEQPGVGTPVAVLPTPADVTEPDLTEPEPLMPTATPILIPADTPTPTPTATATPTATPFVTVPEGSFVTLRTGPDVGYPQVAQLGPNIPVAITGQSIDGAWLEICCISGDALWVPRQHVTINNDIAELAAALAGPPPMPTPTPLPPDTPTVTPTPTATPFPFERAIGPQFFPTGNQFLTIWAKLFIGTPPLEVPAEGYKLMVRFEGFERPNARGDVYSADAFEFSATPGSGNRVEYNYKYEWFPPDPSQAEGFETGLQLIGTGEWTVFVTDGSGTALSEPVTFTTTPSNPNREIYLGWIRVR
jgi:hypothetical protein